MAGASPALLRQVMEGVKRALVIGGRLGWDIGNAVAVFGRIVAGVRPPPEIDPPALWNGRLKELAGLSWPPQREGV